MNSFSPPRQSVSLGQQTLVGDVRREKPADEPVRIAIVAGVIGVQVDVIQ